MTKKLDRKKAEIVGGKEPLSDREAREENVNRRTHSLPVLLDFSRPRHPHLVRTMMLKMFDMVPKMQMDIESGIWISS